MSYTAAIDTVDEGQWHRLLQEFDDASIFQTWAYGAARWGEKNLSHAVITQGGDVIGLAQSVLLGAPLFGKVLAHVMSGPVWQRHGAARSIEHLKTTVTALREEYAMRRRLCLRLRCWGYDTSDDVRRVILADGSWEETRPLHNTYILDLCRTESQLRDAMDKKWRANLRKAEQCGLTVSRCNNIDGIRIFVDLQTQMRRRKHLLFGNTNILPEMYKRLPEQLKPNVFICWLGNAPVATAIVSAIDNHALYFNGASGDAGLEVRAGHFLQWTIVQWLKANGRCRWYDLHGIGSTPGVRQFKRGLVGTKPPEVAMSEFQTYESTLSAAIVGAGHGLREAQRELKGRLAAHEARLGRAVKSLGVI
jgi:hypothetical protein